MLKLNLKRKVQVLVLMLGSAFIAYASVTGPEAAYTSAPGDIGSCVNCHDTFVNPNVGPGSVTIGGVPTVYQPGQQYTLTVTVTQAGRQRYGFQLTAIDGGGNRAGTLASLGGETQLNLQGGFAGRQYIQHTQQGTTPTTGSSRIWQVRWTAPATDIGTVRFFVSGNAANGDGTNQGDHIYTNSALAESATSNVSVTLADPQLSGQTFNAGTMQRVNWNLTGLSNIDLIEVRYSTDDGATFPITNLAFATEDANVTGFDWTLPNVNSATVRLRVQVSTKAGTAVTTTSGRFTIQGEGAPPPSNLPTITRVEITGKKLRIFGINFQMGAQIYLNGDKQKKTVNGEPPSEALIAKKAGKFIAPDTFVTLVVENPDGSKSEDFIYHRPPQ